MQCVEYALFYDVTELVAKQLTHLSWIGLRHRDVAQRVAELTAKARAQDVPYPIAHSGVESLADSLDNALTYNRLLHSLSELSQPLFSRVPSVRRAASPTAFVGTSRLSKHF